MPKPADAPEPLTECANWISPTTRLTAAVKMNDQGEMTRRRLGTAELEEKFPHKGEIEGGVEDGKGAKGAGPSEFDGQLARRNVRF
jgi:hypothetical protein